MLPSNAPDVALASIATDPVLRTSVPFQQQSLDGNASPGPTSQHVQQWLGALQHDVQPSDHIGSVGLPQAGVCQSSEPNRALHAEVLQLKAELMAVKACFADAQVLSLLQAKVSFTAESWTDTALTLA